ncbi:HAD-IIA family hydrolase [Marinobacter zhanjiangensis]|uniref:Haloacid dehalogenase n=1 Tax=Marinobacter zhanjiangensis TaxID=578215 RepID=A0ABQ3B2T3_9GAMM|nr:HAD-IIA family hydrolase [Marinobacter zhanjiangensis]GGY72287.1 haloacid dehalogenase [Marinobacter zhanjiangensis]
MTDRHPITFDGVTPTPAWAFDQYQRLRDQLPESGAGHGGAQWLASLEPLFSRFDAFVFDAFGVLNTGPAVIPGAVERLNSLQAGGRAALILSNAATASQQALTGKYRGMGFDLSERQIISSRWLLEDSLAREPRQGTWGVIAPQGSDSHSLPSVTQQPVRPGVTDHELDACDGFIFLSSEDWDETRQAQLTASLRRRKRPLEVANPDLVAPRGDCLTLEPGFFAHKLRVDCGISPHFYGKPYGPAFAAVLERLAGIPAHRVLMVGDTLHTDILGARAAGMATLLVTDHGALAGMDIHSCIERSGISPDFITPSI